jgi:hypothetical protein
MYSADQQSKSQAAIADYNRQISEQNASWQRMAAERAAQSEQYNAQLAIFNAQSQQSQAAFQSQISTFQNEQLRQQSQFSDMQAQMQRNAAEQMRQQADGQDRQAKEQADRIRAEKNRILGLQRSQFAKGGVTTEGSPLAVLADTANLYEMQVADTKLLANLESNKKRYEADMNSIVGDFNMNADLFSSAMAKKSAAISFNDAQFAEKAAGAGYRINMRQAAIEQQAGYATSRATQLGGYAAGAAGVAQMGQIGLSAYGSSASKSTAKPYDGYVSNNGNLVGYRRATPVRAVS